MAMLSIRFKNSIRSPRALFFMLLIPLMILFPSLLLLNHATRQQSIMVSNAVYPSTEFGGVVLDHDLSDDEFEKILNGEQSRTSNKEIQEWLTLNAPHLGSVTAFIKTDKQTGGDIIINEQLIANSTTLHSAPILLNTLHNTLLNTLSKNKNKPKMKIQSTIMEYPPAGATMSKFLSIISSILIIFSIPLSIYQPAGGFGADLVRDREYKLAFQLRIMGMKMPVYWGSAFLNHMLLFMVPLGMIIPAPTMFDASPFIGDASTMFVASTLLFAMSVVLFACE